MCFNECMCDLALSGSISFSLLFSNTFIASLSFFVSVYTTNLAIQLYMHRDYSNYNFNWSIKCSLPLTLFLWFFLAQVFGVYEGERKSVHAYTQLVDLTQVHLYPFLYLTYIHFYGSLFFFFLYWLWNAVFFISAERVLFVCE